MYEYLKDLKKYESIPLPKVGEQYYYTVQGGEDEADLVFLVVYISHSNEEVYYVEQSKGADELCTMDWMDWKRDIANGVLSLIEPEPDEPTVEMSLSPCVGEVYQLDGFLQGNIPSTVTFVQDGLVCFDNQPPFELDVFHRLVREGRLVKVEVK